MTGPGRSILRCLIGATLFAIMTVVAPAQAVTVSGLYDASVAIGGTAGDDLQAGYEEGLRRVMVRVSGTAEVLGMDGIEGVLDEAESLLLSYQVRSANGGNRLEMSFGAVGVNRALASIEAPVWGANRPLTLAWVAVQERGGRYLLTEAGASERASQWQRAFKWAAASRGLPVAFPPEQVASDRGLLSDLWGQFTGRIRDASETISYGALAMVRVRRSGDQWRADWTHDGMGEARADDSVTASSPAELADAVISRWAEGYASRYAVSAGDVGESPKVDIVLDGVSSLADYGKVGDALENLTPVESVHPLRVRGSRLTVQVTFSGELGQLKEYIALDPRFVVMEAPVTEAAKTPDNGPAQQVGAQGNDAPAAPEPAESQSGGTDAGSEPASESPVAYEPIVEGDEADAEQAFESLYQVLHYRWQPSGRVVDDNAEG
ncbi:DUF2066 domain-containing protein [Marinobacter oulmenensis]|uniref:DUF2066 domain-containing protein n=1 Tax=Marinobacter oulmenensis TaxID=643747 RepID=A0A840UAN2_9GAMM|nr:DUF2066 domain-containing protein [Marinobacter oulmenensis]MBB5322784.1 hypothetical protein [Marinobacter oulmenensis]